MSKSGIHIKPSKKGTFTAAAKKHGKGVQEFARQVMANKENYSPAMVKKANFARNAAKWKHESGGGVDAGYQELGGVHSMRPLPGHQVPVGNAFTATPGHQYPFYERDMQPLPQKAMYGADIEPFVYHGYSDNRPLGDGIRSNWHEPKEHLAAASGGMLQAKAGIHINPANKGKFTATKKRTGKSTEELTHSKNPLTRKRAIFAQNARKWAKKDAGDLLPTNDPKQKGMGSQGDNLYMTPELARQATAAYTPAQNAAANPILTAANSATPLQIQPLNTLTHETGRNTDMGLTSTSGLGRGSQTVVNKKQKPIKSFQTEEKETKDRSWIAPTAMAAAAIINSNLSKGNRQYFTQYDEPYYNPYPTGTGSQAIYAQGGFVNSNAVGFPYKSGITFQNGGGIPRPTSQDSANLYNAQINLNKFYEEEIKKGRLKKEFTIPLSKSDFSPDGFVSRETDDLNERNLRFYRDAIEERQDHKRGTYDDEYKQQFNLSPEQVKKLEYEGLKKTKSANKYQQYYRDIVTPMQNLAAPLAMFDTRVQPQRTIGYKPPSRDYPGGGVQVFDYDPLAIKPYSMRTPEERAQWDKLYGPKTSKKIVSETSKKETLKNQPTAKESVIKPSNVLSAVPYNLESPSVNAGMPYKERSLQQPATNYSVTFRDETSPSKQRTQYFPNLESWRDFTNDSGYLSREESGDGRSASALGYSQFEHGGEIMNVASPQFPIARMGGNIRRNYMSEYEEGGELQLYDDRTGAQPISENPYAGPMVEFKGPSHEERNNVGTNGIPMSWQGNDVEVEGGETAFKDQTGNFQILGNMKNPMTGRKFKNDGKIIAKEEQKANRKLQKGLDLVNEADPDNPFEMLKFNSGKAKMKGAEEKLKNLTSIREQMADIQQKKLDMAAALGIEPMEMDKAYFGKMMTAQGGTEMPFEMDVKGVPIQDYAVQGVRPQGTLQNGPQFFQPANSFSNPAWASYPAQQSAPANSQSNPQFFQPTNNFSNPAWDAYPAAAATSAVAPVIAATQKKAATTLGGRGGEPRRVVPPTEPQEDKTFKPSMPRPVPYDVNTGNIDVATATGVNNRIRKFEFNEPRDKNLISDAEGFNNWNIAPEIFSVLTNQYDPVLMQKYRPELMQPYQMSFQDQLNRNTDTFRSAAKASDWNPSAIASLAAQKYAADQGVLGNEFRTNQEIAANVVNANRQIMNETQKLNLGLADQQYVRQAQARANTRQRDFDALQSASQKRLLHTAAMNKLRTLENMYDYRFDPRYKAMYEGPDAYFRNSVVQNTTPEELRAAVTQKEPKASSKKKFGGSLAKQFKYYKP